MATFFINSTSTKAVRIANIYAVSIVQIEPEQFNVILKYADNTHGEIFEVTTTLVDAQNKAAALLAVLEA